MRLADGILEQTRRHSFITSLLRVPHLVLCVNKMDLVDYAAGTFAERCVDGIEADIDGRTRVENVWAAGEDDMKIVEFVRQAAT